MHAVIHGNALAQTDVERLEEMLAQTGRSWDDGLDDCMYGNGPCPDLAWSLAQTDV